MSNDFEQVKCNDKSNDFDKSNTFEQILNDLVKRMSMYENDILNEIFKNPTLTNIFLKNKTFKEILFDYITTTKNKQYYELIEYFKNDFIERYNNFKFYNGLFTQIDLKKLQETDEGQKQLNTILIFNTKKTTNEKFNNIFDNIKCLEIRNYNFNDIFNNILLNNIRNNYNFKFMEDFEKSTIKINNILCNNITLPNINFKHLTLMDNYILKYNDDSMLFKKWFYLLLCYVYDKKNLTFKELLNIFQNFNILFYHKLISPNDKTDNLITFIYFKLNSENYKPNLRYCLDIPGDNHDDKIRYLKTISNKTLNDYKEFDTMITNDEKGIYINTKNYEQDKIFDHCQILINSKNYNELIYYIFNSQFLNRSTCLFAYFIYFYLTHNILKNKYFDIIALTQNFTTFEKELTNNFNFVHVIEFEKIDFITLDYIIDIIN